jgi:mRNA-degrading endonuclease RelE of RelBE toxin-antitoxin system
MFRIEFVPSALLDLEHLPKAAQQSFVDSIAAQLAHEPLKTTRNRKQLRENPLSTWELRIGTNRVFYDVELLPPEDRKKELLPFALLDPSSTINCSSAAGSLSYEIR